jgi:hypothetical protein
MEIREEQKDKWESVLAGILDQFPKRPKGYYEKRDSKFGKRTWPEVQAMFERAVIEFNDLRDAVTRISKLL